MPNIDELIKTVASLSPTPTKVFIPEVGHRVVTKAIDGRIFDSGGKDFTSSFSLPSAQIEQEVVEDNQRQNVGDLAANQAVNSIRTANLGLFKTINTLKSVQELKQTLLTDLDIDPTTIQDLENIEQYLNTIKDKYSLKKEELRNSF